MINMSMRLKELRKSRNLTQNQLATLFSTQVSTISSYERDANNPSFEMLLKYADYFHVSVDFLLGRKITSISVEGLTEREKEAVQALIDRLRSKDL